ncbi:hypothetical protein L7F22_059552 [Adiantum nelumboides]|nr:hypothetical protein [Adiantum nelumboides]
MQHHIKLKEGSKPIVQWLQRLGVIQQDALLVDVRKLLNAGFIYPVEDSEWVSPVVVTPKKNGKWQVCVDYNPLNAATKRDHFPLPFQDEILNEVTRYERYTVCDGYSGYFQIRIAEEDQKKTTFVTPWGKANNGIKRLNAFGDALLLVKQVHGTWACRNQGLVVRLRMVKELLKRFEVAHLLHVPRKDNQETDTLASVCGGHFSHDITSRKILQTGFVWPSLHRDVRHWCQSYHRCQLAGDRRLTYEPQTPILAHGPFEKWGIDAIGPLLRATFGKLYIIMGIDYMTRWTEATTTSRITTVEVAKFIFEHICCRFGVPLEILSNRGPGFRGDIVGELMKKLEIKRKHSTPYYPQCNGLVEKVNGMICKIITKQVVSKPKEWDKHLEAALWSYRTSFRTSLSYTPYHLVFGKEAILPIEVQLVSLRVLASGRETPKERLQQRILDLERLELDRTSVIEFYATQAERQRQKFNEDLKDKELKRGVLVLRYDNRFDNRKDK